MANADPTGHSEGILDVMKPNVSLPEKESLSPLGDIMGGVCCVAIESLAASALLVSGTLGSGGGVKVLRGGLGGSE